MFVPLLNPQIHKEGYPSNLACTNLYFLFMNCIQAYHDNFMLIDEIFTK